MTMAVGTRRSSLIDRLGWLLASVFTNRGQQWAAERMAGTNGNTG